MNIVSLTRVKDQFDEISLVSAFLFLLCTYLSNKTRCDSYCSFAGTKIRTFTINPKLLRNCYLPMPVCHVRTGTNVEKFSMISSRSNVDGRMYDVGIRQCSCGGSTYLLDFSHCKLSLKLWTFYEYITYK